MMREMFDTPEGILSDLHQDHEEISSLIDQLIETKEGRGPLFQEIMSKLLAHAHAEQNVLYRKMEKSDAFYPSGFTNGDGSDKTFGRPFVELCPRAAGIKFMPASP